MSAKLNTRQHDTNEIAETQHCSGNQGKRPRRSFIERMSDRLRPAYDGPVSWLWYTGIARIIILVVVAAGAHQMTTHILNVAILTAIYLAALGCNLWYLFAVQKVKAVTSTITWTQMFVDFSVVAVTVSFTGGTTSFFSFLFIIVILEAGALMGLVQGFVFAGLSALFLVALGLPTTETVVGILPYWYNFLIQCLALVSAAVVSGYWNQRISRLKQFQREILDNMSSGFLISDARGRVISINKAACIMLERPEDEVMGKNVTDVLVCESGMECPIITALRNERDYFSYEFQARISDRESKLFGLTTNRLYDHGNRLIAVIAAFTDLTEMALMRQALHRQDRLAAIGESAAELAHEVRNPLASLRTAIDELRGHIPEQGMGHRLCCIALRESEHLNSIVSGFLEFARNPEFEREPVDAMALLEDIKSTVEFGLPGVTVHIKHDGAPCMIQGDTTQIRQLFDNIVSNSVEAMAQQGALIIGLRSADNYVEFRFDDTGPGIPPDKMARVFEPFYTEKENGIGMGLAICQRIVTAHDGDIQAATRPGGGVSMVVRLPLTRPVTFGFGDTA